MKNYFDILEYIVSCKPELDSIINPIIEEKNELLLKEDLVFHDLIKEEFKEVVTKILVDHITKSFAISTEEVMIMLEDIDLEKIFK